MKIRNSGFAVFFCILLYYIGVSSIFAGHKPSDQPRIKSNFNADWRFSIGDQDSSLVSSDTFDDRTWQAVHLPHFPEMLPLRPEWKREHGTIQWYRKSFRLNRKDSLSKIFIEFEAADQVADVWVNGRHCLTHTGSYLPFTIDITGTARFGKKTNIIAVRVDNHRNPDIPVYGSWISSGGLYRDVFLVKTDRLHITDPVLANELAGGGVFVTYPLVTDTLAQVKVTTEVLNEWQRPANCAIKACLIGKDGIAASAETGKIIPGGNSQVFTLKMALHSPRLWHPDHPNLYTLRIEVRDSSRLADTEELKIGIRHVEFTRDSGFFINGERLLFMGTNRVQEYPYAGWAVPNTAQRRDAIRLKKAGFQFVRTSHNPQDPSFLDACDELGILVMDCIPGFQYIGGSKFRENSYGSMRDMIRRDRNHPAIVLWELSLNETDYDSAFAQTAMKIGHEEFPGDQCFVAGWKFPEIYDVFLQAAQHGARDYRGPAPLVISEYGHWDYGEGESTSDADRSKGEAAMLQQAHNHQESLNLNRSLPFISGDGLWVAMDFQRYPSGVIDYFRLPKFSCYFYSSQRSPGLIIPGISSGPMAYIANYWTEKSPRTVTVYSNCERVDLYLNGQLMARERPDTSALSGNLLHPPFIFRDLPFSPGELKAVGFIAGREAASHRRITPGPPAGIGVTFEMKGPALADGEDLFFVYASIRDANGTVIHEGNTEIAFHVKGPGVLVSPEKVTAEGGIAAALIRTTGWPGKITVRAEAEGLGKAAAQKLCLKAE
jgi:beta-galactosidase